MAELFGKSISAGARAAMPEYPGISTTDHLNEYQVVNHRWQGVVGKKRKVQAECYVLGGIRGQVVAERDARTSIDATVERDG